MILISVHLISNAVVGNVTHDKKVYTTNGFINRTFCFSGTESGTFAVNQERILRITGPGKSIFLVGR